MILNVGSGDLPIFGACNIDLRPEVANVVADVRHLPIASASADMVVAHDILEHLPRQWSAYAVAEWARVAKVGGRLSLKVPNMAAIGALLAEEQSVGPLMANVYGGARFGPDGAWDTHYWGWTPRTLEALLTQEGWRPMSNDGGLNMLVEAERG